MEIAEEELSIELLGAPVIRRAGSAIEVDTRKATALLAYLAVTGREHRRDSLAALLWPDYDHEHARAALRRTLSTLKAALAGEGLAISRATVGITDSVRVDLELFRLLGGGCGDHRPEPNDACEACMGALTEASGLYKGDFMSGFALRDSAEFDDWHLLQADELRRNHHAVLEALMRAHRRRGELRRAIEYARRRLAADSLHEPAHRELMELYALDGQRTASLAQYRECVAVLDRELGVTPLPETAALYQDIKEGRLPAAPGREAPPAAQPHMEARADKTGRRLPLVGRSQEWAALHSTYNSIGPRGHLVVIDGEAGIGKSRLAEDFLDEVGRHGAYVIRAQGHAGERGLAHGITVELLRSAMAQPGAPERIAAVAPAGLVEAGRLVPDLLEVMPQVRAAPSLESPGARARLLEGLTNVLLTAATGKRPGVIFVDDLQWVDGASFDVLSFIIRRLPDRPLYLLATWRVEDVPGDHRLRRLAEGARRSKTFTGIRPGRLTEGEAAELVAAAGPDAPGSEGLRRRLYEETEGLPFFLTEYLEVVGRSDGQQWDMPEGVRDLLGARVESLDQIGRQVLDAAAVAGRSFHLDTLRSVSGRDEEEIVEGLEGLVRSGVITELSGASAAGTPMYDFSHDKLRGFVYEATSLARRRLLHRRMAEALVRDARRKGGSPSYSPIAHHYRLGGRDEDAAHYSFVAGEQARSLYANEEALAHFQTALALGHPRGSATHEAIGDLQTLRGQYGEALTSYETAAAQSEGPDLALIEQKLGQLHDRLGDAGADSHFEAALALLDNQSGTAALKASLTTDRSLAAHHAAKRTKAHRLAQQALGLAEEAGDATALARAHNILGILATADRDADAALEHLKGSLALARKLSDHSTMVAALNNLALADRASGRIDEAIELMAEAIDLCASQGDRHREAALHSNMSDLLHQEHRPEEAMAHFKKSAALFAAIGEPGDMTPGIWKLVEW
ncbi:MAG: AAA family ATPase [Actinobacteria bacterium]|nr:AAA family ATPase [Actinomycetota bacterium]